LLWGLGGGNGKRNSSRKHATYFKDVGCGIFTLGGQKKTVGGMKELHLFTVGASVQSWGRGKTGKKQGKPPPPPLDKKRRLR